MSAQQKPERQRVLICPESLWVEFCEAASVLAKTPETPKHASNYSTSMERTHAISRVVEAKRRLVLGLRVCETSDRTKLHEELDRLRVKPAQVTGPKPRIKDPLTGY
jgi:hypothetical protein